MEIKVALRAKPGVLPVEALFVAADTPISIMREVMRSARDQSRLVICADVATQRAFISQARGMGYRVRIEDYEESV